MYSSTLTISLQHNSPAFEYVRWHTLNYILNQGETAVRSPLEVGRNRPRSHESEFATVFGKETVYSFKVDSEGPERSITIFVCSPQEKDLEKAVAELIEKTDLKIK